MRLTLFILLLLNGVYSEPNKQINPIWEEGDSWLLQVKRYDHYYKAIAVFTLPGLETKVEEPELISEFQMKVTVKGTTYFQSKACWELEFIPLIDEKTKIRTLELPTYVFYDKENYEIIGAYSIRKERHDYWSLVKFEEHYSLPLVLGDLLPTTTKPVLNIDSIPNQSFELDASRSDFKTKIKVAKEFKNDSLIIQYNFMDRYTPYSIKETWTPNAKWWSHFEGIQNGKLSVQASLIEED